MSEMFRATIALDGKTATGINVPTEVVTALGGGGRVPVQAKLSGHTYATTIARMRGEYKFPVSAAVREAAGVAAGDVLDVTLTRDDEPREIAIPPALQTALDADGATQERFASLSYTNATATRWRSRAPRPTRPVRGAWRRSWMNSPTRTDSRVRATARRLSSELRAEGLLTMRSRDCFADDGAER